MSAELAKADPAIRHYQPTIPRDNPTADEEVPIVAEPLQRRVRVRVGIDWGPIVVVDSSAVDIVKPHIDPEFQREFSELFQRWHLDTLKYSNPTDITGHLSYYKIVALGEPAVPLLLRELKRGSGFLFLALRAITRHNPVPPEHMGSRTQMTADWLRWGNEHGYTRD